MAIAEVPLLFRVSILAQRGHDLLSSLLIDDKMGNRLPSYFRWLPDIIQCHALAIYISKTPDFDGRVLVTLTLPLSISGKLRRRVVAITRRVS